MTWTDARIAQLAHLWAQGVSASGIAEALGEVSRSAVLGKLHRLKLLGSRKPASAPRRYEGRPAGVAEAAALWTGSSPPRAAVVRSGPPPGRSVPWREAAFAPLGGTEPRPWLTRDFGECAFPVGEDAEAVLSCCAPVRPRSAYCATHHDLVFRPTSPAVRAAEERRWAEFAETAANERRAA